MLRLTYLTRNLGRNPSRTALTIAAVGMPIMIYVLAASVIAGLNLFLSQAVKSLRLVVTHRAGLVHPLPAGHRRRIEAMDPARTRIVSVCGMRFIGGRVEGSKLPLSSLAVDKDTFADTFANYHLTQEELDAWLRDSQAIVVGSGIAAMFGWETGDRITIRPTLPPYTPLEFHVVATSARSHDPITNLCRRDYLERELEKYRTSEELVTFFMIKCGAREDLEHFRIAIDEELAKTNDPTRTQDEKSFLNDFIVQQFNLPRTLTILSAITVFVAGMAAANTMSMNFRDRSTELAVLKALGFAGRVVFGMLQIEGLLLCGLGGVLGALIPYVAFMHTPLKEYPIPIIQTLIIDREVCVKAVLLSLVVGIVAALWPSWAAYRLNVVRSLRNLE